MGALSTALLATAFGALLWGGAIAFVPQLSVAPKDISTDVRYISKTTIIHRGKALQRLLREHAYDLLEADEVSIYTRTVQLTEDLTAAARRARFYDKLCSFARVLLYVSVATAPVTLAVAALGYISQTNALIVLLAVVVAETLLGLFMYMLAQKVRSLADSNMIVVGGQ
jgi:hypothetical protein